MINQRLERKPPDSGRINTWIFKNSSGMKPKKMKKVDLAQFIREKRNVPKRLSSPREMFKHFVSSTNWHGVKYWLDDDLCRVERFLWFILDLVCFISSLYIIFIFYQTFNERKTDITIDDLQYGVQKIPFPGVTVCPNSRIDYRKVPNALKKWIPHRDDDMKDALGDLLRNMSNMKFTQFQEVRSNISEPILDILEQVNITKLLREVMPDCKDIFSECKWKHSEIDCCEIFKVSKSYYGFCYGMSENYLLNDKTTQRSHSSESESGLTFTLKYIPDGSNQTIVSIDDGKKYVTKGSVFVFGRKYEINVKAMSTFATEEVLALSNDPNRPCRFDNGTYKYSNCLSNCVERKVIDQAKCNPLFFFPYVEGVPDCTIKNFKSIEGITERVQDAFDVVFGNGSENMNCIRACPKECAYEDYDSFVQDIPFEINSTRFDIHFYSRTGIRYKQDIVVNPLDMLVQFGGIFGLFLGGSIITLVEICYCLVIILLYYIRKMYRYATRKNESDMEKLMIYIMSQHTTRHPFTN